MNFMLFVLSFIIMIFASSITESHSESFSVLTRIYITDDNDIFISVYDHEGNSWADPKQVSNFTQSAKITLKNLIINSYDDIASSAILDAESTSNPPINSQIYHNTQDSGYKFEDFGWPGNIPIMDTKSMGEPLNTDKRTIQDNPLNSKYHPKKKTEEKSMLDAKNIMKYLMFAAPILLGLWYF